MSERPALYAVDPPQADEDTTEAADVAEAKPQKRRSSSVLYTKHDVKRAAQRCNDLLLAITTRVTAAQKEIGIDQAKVDSKAQAYACCRLLVLKGLVTEEEMETERLMAVGDLYADILLQIEQQLLNGGQPERSPQQKRSDLAVVQTPGIIVPKH